MKSGLLILVALWCGTVGCRAQSRPESSASRTASAAASAIHEIEAMLMRPGVPRGGLLAKVHSLDPTGDAAIPALTRLLEHPARRVREEAADGLGKFGGRAAPAVPGLLKAFEDPIAESAEYEGPNETRLEGEEIRDWLHREHFVDAIASIGPAAGEVAVWRLTRALIDERGLIRFSLLAAIVQIDRQGDSFVIEVIARQLEDPDDGLCRAAADALARFGPRAASALPALKAGLAGRDRVTEQRIRAAMGAIAAATPEAHAVLVDGLASSQTWVVRNAVLALDAVDSRDATPEVEQRMRELAESPRSATGVYAAHRLARAGRAAVRAVPTLMTALQSSFPNVQVEAAHALGAIGPESAQAVPVLMRVLARCETDYRPADPPKDAALQDLPLRYRPITDAEWWRREVAEAVIVALGRIGPAAKEAVPLMSRVAMIGIDPEWQKGIPLFAGTAIDRIEPPARTELKVVVDAELVVPAMGDRNPCRQPFVEEEPDGSIRVTVSHRGSLFGDSIDLFLSRDSQGRPTARVDYWHHTDVGPPFEWKVKVDGGTVTLRFPEWGHGKPLAGVASVGGSKWAFELVDPFEDRR
jgi:HEAT repeat protein